MTGRQTDAWRLNTHTRAFLNTSDKAASISVIKDRRVL